MPYTGTPKTWVAGEVVTAANLNANLRDLGRGFSDAWTSYTPTLTASSSNPTGWTYVGYYMQVGKLVVAKFVCTAGGSMTEGTGDYRVALPVNANITAFTPIAGTALCVDSSTGARHTPTIIIPNTAYCEFRYPVTWPSGANTATGSGKPWTWAASDSVAGTIIYEAA